MPTRRRAMLLFGLLLPATGLAAPAEKPPVTVYAAISLTDVLDELGTEFRRTSGTPLKFSYAASSVLARQIEAGSGAEVFVSADQEWMNYLDQRRLIRRDTRVDVAANSLVLVAPVDSTVQLKIAPGFALAAALGTGRLALADPGSVPAGRYAKAALTALGVWDAVQLKVVGAENVRAALTYVARGETPLGIVYSTDAKADSRVRVVDVFPAATHPPITYPAAATTRAGSDAQAFAAFLASPAAQRVFAKHGFRPPR